MPEAVTTMKADAAPLLPGDPSAPAASLKGPFTAPSTASSQRSPGLILLVAAIALCLISIQSISEMSELLFHHVDDSLLEDGTFFAGLDFSGEGVHLLSDIQHNETAATAASTLGKDEIIVLDVRTVDLRDHFGLLRPHMTVEELKKVFETCARIWFSQAKVRLNFTFSTLSLDSAEEDAHRWFLLGSKDQRIPTFWHDVSLYLRKGGSRMSTKQVAEIVTKSLQASGYPLMDWITKKVQDAFPESQLSIVPVAYWPWNNGGNFGKRTFFRAGACSIPPVPPKHLSKKHRKHQEEAMPCNGWSPVALAQSKPTVPEAARTLAHLIGSRLGLKRVGGERCSVKSVGENLALMCVPSPEAREVETFYTRAVHLNPQERAIARVSAEKLAKVGMH